MPPKKDIRQIVEEVLSEVIPEIKSFVEKLIADAKKELMDMISKEPPQDVRVEKIASRVAAKLSVLEKGDPGHMGPKPMAGIDYPIPKNGAPGTQGPPGPQGDPGPKGDFVIGPSGPQGDPGPTGSPDTPEQIRKKLESSKDLPQWLWSLIKDYIPKTPAMAFRGGGGGDTMNYRNLSTLTDGATKTFTLTRVKNVLGVFGTSFPNGGWNPGVDWTYDQTTGILTLGSGITAPETGQTLWALVIES